MPSIDREQIGVAFDMQGCPNRCRHCWLGPAGNSTLSEENVRWGVSLFRDFISLNTNPIRRLSDASSFREPGLAVILHSDGQIAEIIPDLVDVGMTVLNPVQPEVLDHAWLKRTFGDRLSFYGGISTQTVLPHGTPAEVREAVRSSVSTLPVKFLHKWSGFQGYTAASNAKPGMTTISRNFNAIAAT